MQIELVVVTVEGAEDVCIELLDVVVLLEESWRAKEADASAPSAWGGGWTGSGSESGSGDKLSRKSNPASKSKPEASAGSIARGKRGGVSDPSSALSSASGPSPVNMQIWNKNFHNLQWIELLIGEVATSRKDRSSQDRHSVHVAASVWIIP